MANSSSQMGSHRHTSGASKATLSLQNTSVMHGQVFHTLELSLAPSSGPRLCQRRRSALPHYSLLLVWSGSSRKLRLTLFPGEKLAVGWALPWLPHVQAKPKIDQLCPGSSSCAKPALCGVSPTPGRRVGSGL